MSYVDTSVIAAALDSSDARQYAALEALESRREKVVSELVLLELAGILARRREILEDLARSLGIEARDLLLPAAILYIVRKFKLRYVQVEGSESYYFLAVSKPVSRALKLSSTISLGALDLMHLAYIDALRDQGEDLEELLTADEDFSREAEIIEKLVGVKVTQLTPQKAYPAAP